MSNSTEKEMLLKRKWLIWNDCKEGGEGKEGRIREGGENKGSGRGGGDQTPTCLGGHVEGGEAADTKMRRYAARFRVCLEGGVGVEDKQPNTKLGTLVGVRMWRKCSRTRRNVPYGTFLRVWLWRTYRRPPTRPNGHVGVLMGRKCSRHENTSHMGRVVVSAWRGHRKTRRTCRNRHVRRV